MNKNENEAARSAGASAGARQQNPAAVNGIVERALKELVEWAEERPRKDRNEKLFYCPVCSFTTTESYYRLKKYGKPKCPTCGVEMADFDEVKFRELRRRLAEEARKILPDAVKALLEVAKIHGGTGEPEVKAMGPTVVVKPDHANSFSYNASKRRLEAFFYYYDMESHEKALKMLAVAARRLDLGIYVVIYAGHARMDIPFPFRHLVDSLVIEMNSDELRGYMMATSYWL